MQLPEFHSEKGYIKNNEILKQVLKLLLVASAQLIVLYQVVSFSHVSIPKFCIHLSSPIRTTRPIHPILLDFSSRK
jgi:hypothetical protein